ncbi:MAG: hypothetical protein R3313_00185 [Candidatus Saccharimonadales bacterium]|nr:hypothetical protein [Candidatus Saccharimonadales bacterium]
MNAPNPEIEVVGIYVGFDTRDPSTTLLDEGEALVLRPDVGVANDRHIDWHDGGVIVGEQEAISELVEKIGLETKRVEPYNEDEITFTARALGIHIVTRRLDGFKVTKMYRNDRLETVNGSDLVLRQRSRYAAGNAGYDVLAKRYSGVRKLWVTERDRSAQAVRSTVIGSIFDVESEGNLQTGSRLRVVERLPKR